MSLQKDIIEILLRKGEMNDIDLADILNRKISRIQHSCHMINFNEKKFKDFTIIRHGKQRSYSRELITRDSSVSDILIHKGRKIKKGLKQFKGARKDGIIGISTKEGKELQIFMKSIWKQNLDAMIETQKLLQ